MAYALVAWAPPAGTNPDTVSNAILDAMTHTDGARRPIRFLDRVALYPSGSTGVSLRTVRDRLRPVARHFPGVEILIIMPDAGDEVAGWLDAANGTFDDARPILNKSGDLYPLLWDLRGSGDDSGGGP